MKNLECITINNQFDARLWNASTEKRARQIINSRSRRIRRLITHVAIKGIGLGLLCIACVIEPSYGNIAVNALYAACGVGLVILG